MNSCGNAATVESVEKQIQLFHPSHRLLEISQPRRDSHIPTATTAVIITFPFGENTSTRTQGVNHVPGLNCQPCARPHNPPAFAGFALL